MKLFSIKIALVVGVIGTMAIGYKTNLIPALSDSTLPGEEYEIVYKWRDSAGKYHYSNEIPEGNKNAVKIEIPRQLNIVKSKKSGADQVTGKPSFASGEKSRLSGILESYNKPIEKAIDVRNKMEQRNRKLEKALQ